MGWNHLGRHKKFGGGKKKSHHEPGDRGREWSPKQKEDNNKKDWNVVQASTVGLVGGLGSGGVGSRKEKRKNRGKSGGGTDSKSKNVHGYPLAHPNKDRRNIRLGRNQRATKP